MTDREAFESCISASPYELDITRRPDKHGVAWPGTYVDAETDLAWCIWQDAIDSTIDRRKK